MRKNVYLETSFISYLTGKESSNEETHYRQKITKEWWDFRRPLYEVFLSQIVVKEMEKGDFEAVQKRKNAVVWIPVLPYDEAAERLSSVLMESGLVPIKAKEDADHIAIATVHHMDVLVTWNCKHIANSNVSGAIADLIRKERLTPPALLTPKDFMTDNI